MSDARGAVYVEGRTGAFPQAGKEILSTVPCDEGFPDGIAEVIQSLQAGHAEEPAFGNDPYFAAAATSGLATWRPCNRVESQLPTI